MMTSAHRRPVLEQASHWTEVESVPLAFAGEQRHCREHDDHGEILHDQHAQVQAAPALLRSSRRSWRTRSTTAVDEKTEGHCDADRGAHSRAQQRCPMGK